MNIFRKLLVDFKDNEQKVERLKEIDLSLVEVNSIKDYLYETSQTFKKSIDQDIDCIEDINSKKEDFKKSYVRQVASLKLKESKLNEEKDYILKALVGTDSKEFLGKIYNLFREEDGSINSKAIYVNKYKLRDLQGFPESQDLENCYIIFINNDSMVLCINGDWQRKLYIEIKLVNSELSINNLGYGWKGKAMGKEILNNFFKTNFKELLGTKSEEISKSIQTVKGFYKLRKIGLNQYNDILKSITKEKKTKYADICVLNNKGELLLLKRSDFDSTHAGAYVIPGGHVDIGEDFETAARRELLEESGISVDNLLNTDNPFKPSWGEVGKYEDENAEIHYFLLQGVDNNNFELLLQEEEMRGYKWIDRSEIDNYPMVFSMQANVKKVLNWEETPQIKIIRKAYDLGLVGEEVLEKAFNIGTIRRWGENEYRKVNNGEWVKINNKSKIVSKNTIKKLIKTEIDSNQLSVLRFKSLLHDKYMELYPNQNTSSITFRVSLSRFIDSDEQYKEFLKEIITKNAELNEEIREIDVLLKQEADKKIEDRYSKKLFSIENFNELYKPILDRLRDVSKISDYVDPAVRYPIITFDDYYLNTETDFKSVVEYKPFKEHREDGDYMVDNVDREWKKLIKDNPDFKHKFSPKSSSQYLLDEETGDIYRVADHWGTCASCYWDNSGWSVEYGIGVSNIKDFIRKPGSWLNNDKLEIVSSIHKEGLDIIREILSNNRYIFKKQVMVELKQIAQNSAHIIAYNSFEFDKTKKEIEDNYNVIFKNINLHNDVVKSLSDQKEAMDHPNKLGEGTKKRKHLNPKDKFEVVMKEFANGTLHSGDGSIVTDKDQALAIAYSESGLEKSIKIIESICPEILDDIEKALKGIYGDTYQNRMLGRVGQKFDYTLSAYTIASNCSDISDCEAGISELNEYFNKENSPTKTAYIRLYKLNEKLNKFKKQEYGRISEQAGRIISGEEYIERLSPTEEQGRIRGGKRNVEATLLLRGKEVTGDEDGLNVDKLITEQEKILENYAKESGIWVDNETIEKDWLFVDKGEEAKVYDDGQYIKKVYDYQMMSISPLEFIDNRISLHNFMFPATSYELIGFTRTNKGFSFILRQPYIQNFTKTQIPIIKEEMRKRGFKQLDEKSYYNDNYIVEDLHTKNVLTNEKTGKLYFIDTVVSLNEEGEGYGGKREYKKIKVISSDKNIEKSFDKISELYLQGIIDTDLFEKAEFNYFEKSLQTAQIGEIRTRKDGTKWKKIATGTGKSDWKQVTKDKENKEEEPNSNKTTKTEEKTGKKLSYKEIIEAAKNTSENALNTAIKESKDPEVRSAAQKEIDRRDKEEKVQEEPKEKVVKNTDRKEISEENKGEENSFSKFELDLHNKYRDITEKLMNDDFSDSKNSNELYKKQKEISRYIQRLKIVEGESIKKQESKLRKLLPDLKTSSDVKNFIGDGDVLGLKVDIISDDEFSLSSITEDCWISRIFNKKTGSVQMEEMILSPDKEQGKGIGVKIFFNQVKEFKKNGFSSLETNASNMNGLNGSYTWAKLGYKDVYGVLNGVFDRNKKNIPDSLKGIRSLSELMSSKEGSNFWLKYGESFRGVFDLDDNSDSMKILTKYMEGK